MYTSQKQSYVLFARRLPKIHKSDSYFVVPGESLAPVSIVIVYIDTVICHKIAHAHKTKRAENCEMNNAQDVLWMTQHCCLYHDKIN